MAALCDPEPAPGAAPEHATPTLGDPWFDVGGDRLRLLDDGPERLERLIRLIEAAQRELRLLYYIYSADAAGERVRAALLDARRRGVAVTLMVDGFGSDAGDAFFKPLRDAGACVCRFLPRWGRRYLLRNHQKLALADQTVAMIGGFNISNDYFAPVGPGAWRDLGLEVHGPAAARLTGYFDALHAWAQRDRARMRDLRHALRHWSEPEGAVRWLLGGPTRRLSPWALTVKRDMRDARELDVIAAYFAPNPAMLRRVERVARDGQARVVTAALSDNTATIAAARHTYRRMLARGVRVFEYQRAKLHTKLFVVDDAVHLGSANFDVRSLYLNLELMLRVEDRAFADHMRRYVASEIEQSEEITVQAHRARSSWIARIRWGIAYFVVAVLDSSITRRLNFGADGRQ